MFCSFAAKYQKLSAQLNRHPKEEKQCHFRQLQSPVVPDYVHRPTSNCSPKSFRSNRNSK